MTVDDRVTPWVPCAPRSSRRARTPPDDGASTSTQPGRRSRSRSTCAIRAETRRRWSRCGNAAGRGHGDYLARNLLVAPNRPGDRHRPATALAGSALRGPRPVHHQHAPARPTSASHGHAFGPAQLERYQSEFLRGYFGEDATPIAGVRTYQLLILLDKGAAAASAVDAGSGRWFDRYFHREATRLLVLLDQLSGPSSRSAPGRLR